MTPFVQAGDAWGLWAVMIAGAAACILLEQRFKWAARTSGPVLALIGGMLLSNLKLLPTDSPSFDIVDRFLVPVAIPLLLFRANVVRIVRESGTMFLAFHVAAIGTVLGAFIAGIAFRGAFPRVPEVTGIMTGSYIGGGVNFVAIQKSYNVSSELANPLLVADNFIMAGIFAVLFFIASSGFFLRRYRHPHSVDAVDAASLASQHWHRKQIALLDIAQALAIAFVIAAVSIKATDAIKAATTNKLVHAVFGNAFVLITILTVLLTTFAHRWTEQIHGSEELGVFLLYIFFFVIGLRADLWQVVLNIPVLFGFCLVMALTNLTFTLLAGRLLRLNLEELLLAVNATLGGPASAAAMAISKGWSGLVLPGILAGLWGYVIGTFVGIIVAEALMRL